MKNTHRSIGRRRHGRAAGFSLIEVMVSVAIMTVIMGATMTALSQAMKANETAVLVTSMNSTLRTGMDLMIRDMLQVGSGLPPGHYVLIPSGSGTRINMPGPPGTAYKSVLGDTDLNAVNPGTGLGPLVNQVAPTACTVVSATCVATDMITTLAADSTFTHIPLIARAADGTSITVMLKGLDNIAGTADDINIGAGPDRVGPGQLIMLEKGSYAILVQVTSIDAVSGVISFAKNADSLNLNVHDAPSGSMGAPCGALGCAAQPATGLTGAAPSPDTALPFPQTVPPTTFLNTVATRIRMISYYIDNTDLLHPKLVRRINNGNQTTFDNLSGSTVAFDIDNMKISYDLADGVNNWAGVTFTNADLAGTVGGRCLPAACSVNQIRKVNITLRARSRSPFSATKQYFRNTLTTQVSLRGMAFVNEYVQ